MFCVLAMSMMVFADGKTTCVVRGGDNIASINTNIACSCPATTTKISFIVTLQKKEDKEVTIFVEIKDNDGKVITQPVTIKAGSTYQHATVNTGKLETCFYLSIADAVCE